MRWIAYKMIGYRKHKDEIDSIQNDRVQEHKDEIDSIQNDRVQEA